MYYIIKAWQAKTSDACLLSFDNAKIQAVADISELYDPRHPGEKEHAITIDQVAVRLHLPPYSHDLNRPIEHIFGTMKHKIREELYLSFYKHNTPDGLQKLVLNQFTKHLPPKQVQEDVKGLPLLWEVLSVPAGITFVDSKGQLAVGTGGDWPNAEYR